MLISWKNILAVLILWLCGLLVIASVAQADPWADFVVSYESGGGSIGYDDPTTALGMPTRMTADWSGGLEQVQPFTSPWQTTEIVSIGPTGHLIVGFNEPIFDDASHPFGKDLIVFGNAFLYDANWPSGTCTNPAMIGSDPGKIEVSPDGTNWYEIPGVFADGLFPTLGYTDATYGGTSPGSQPSDFQMPMDPALTLSDLDGLTFNQVIALYGVSGGGAAIDIATAIDELGNPAGLTEIQYVRITSLGDYGVEIDGFAATAPEPATMLIVGIGIAGLRMFGKRQ